MVQKLAEFTDKKNFNYSAEDFDYLLKIAKEIMTQAATQETIKKAIACALESKNKATLPIIKNQNKSDEALPSIKSKKGFEKTTRFGLEKISDDSQEKKIFSPEQNGAKNGHKDPFIASSPSIHDKGKNSSKQLQIRQKKEKIIS